MDAIAATRGELQAERETLTRRLSELDAELRALERVEQRLRAHEARPASPEPIRRAIVFPGANGAGNGAVTANPTGATGAADAVRAYLAGDIGDFTIREVQDALPDYSEQAIRKALRRAAARGRIVPVKGRKRGKATLFRLADPLAPVLALARKGE